MRTLKETYETPMVRIIEVRVEQGFAISGGETQSLQEQMGAWSK